MTGKGGAYRSLWLASALGDCNQPIATAVDLYLLPLVLAFLGLFRRQSRISTLCLSKWTHVSKSTMFSSHVTVLTFLFVKCTVGKCEFSPSVSCRLCWACAFASLLSPSFSPSVGAFRSRVHTLSLVDIAAPSR